MNEKKCVTLIVVGCGNRGEVYSSYSLKHPDRARVIGFADPRPYVVKKFLEMYKSTADRSLVFSDWQEFIKLDKRVSDCVLITLPDRLHKQAAIEFTRLGYHILVEKPMATLLDDCRQITMACREKERQINAVCHVMRYYGPCIKIKQLIESGVIGEVLNITHTEPVGFWHFAHSFVRGNWHREDDSSFSLLAKCCHDIDLIVYWMGSKKRCTKVSSFGSVQHFRKEKAPSNATDNCLSCPAEETCCYSAKKIYLNERQSASNWPSDVALSAEINNVLTEAEALTEADVEDLFTEKTPESHRRALLERCLTHPNTNYGRCVYSMNNDVCDNQVVTMQFDDGSLATMTMIATSKDTCARKTIVYGSRGQLDWDDASEQRHIKHYDFLTRANTLIDYSDAVPAIKKAQSSVENKNIRLTGHGGADYFLMDAFVEAVLQDDKSYVLTDVDDSFRSHLIVFAAEYSRRTGSVVDVDDFCRMNNITL